MTVITNRTEQRENPREPGKTSVVYIKSHNHLINIYNTQFQPIPKSVKTSVAAKLAFGVPVPQNYGDLRLTVGGREQRSESEPPSKTHLITKKNIVSQYHKIMVILD